jgi:hypothetical protein
MEAFLARTTGVCECNFAAARFDHLAQSDVDQFLLLREMHHRFANSFTFLTAMLRGSLVRPRCRNFKARSNGARRGSLPLAICTDFSR